MPATYFPMGTLVRVTSSRHGLQGNIGRIYGQCRGSDLYNIWADRGMWHGKPLHWSDGSTRAQDFNLFPSEFEIVFEEG